MDDLTYDDTNTAAVSSLPPQRPVVPSLSQASVPGLGSVQPPNMPTFAGSATTPAPSLSGPPVAPPAFPSAAPTVVPAAALPATLPMTAPVAPISVPGLAPIAVAAQTVPFGAPVPAPSLVGPAMPPPASTPGFSALESTDHDSAPKLILDDLLNYMVEAGGSDLHLTAGSPPVIRLRGEFTRIPNYDALTPSALRDALYAVMGGKQQHKFEEKKELDFAYTVPGKARFRVNVFQQRGSIGSVMRVIPWDIKALEDLNMPEILGTFSDLPRGFVLVTGPTGSGKSTTLAAMIDKANRTRKGHIMTIEDPVEFIHQHRSSLVNQREVGEDTHSFKDALKHVLRQDPDIILVGELRDLETISVALTAAETGHLVFATLHTQSAQETITRIIDVFPPEQQQQVRTQLAASLQGVVCQTLCKTRDGKGRVAAVEVMICDSGIRAMIRDNKLQQIQGALQAGGKKGMQTLNQHLSGLVKSGKITYDEGLEKCSDKADFLDLTGSREDIATAIRRTESLGGMHNYGMGGIS